MRLLLGLLITFALGVLVGMSDLRAAAPTGVDTICVWCEEVMLPCKRMPVHEDCYGPYAEWLSSPADRRGITEYDRSSDPRGVPIPPADFR